MLDGWLARHGYVPRQQKSGGALSDIIVMSRDDLAAIARLLGTEVRAA